MWNNHVNRNAEAILIEICRDHKLTTTSSAGLPTWLTAGRSSPRKHVLPAEKNQHEGEENKKKTVESGCKLSCDNECSSQN